MTDPFATADDAAGYAFPLPDATADGLLARATQAIIDAAGFGILSADATVSIRADRGALDLDGVPLVTAVTGVELVHEDNTTEAVTDYHVLHAAAGPLVVKVLLGRHAPERHCGRFAVSLTQGLASVPNSLKLLTSQVAFRFAAMPAAMSAGIVSRSVGGVSWSVSSPPPDDDLTARELAKLGKIVPLKRVGGTKL